MKVLTAPSTVDAAGRLGKFLEGDDGDTDLARAMLQTFARTLMSAEASAAAVLATTSGSRGDPGTNIRGEGALAGEDERASGTDTGRRYMIDSGDSSARRPFFLLISPRPSPVVLSTKETSPSSSL